MNLEKIGIFISEMRKQKGLTQQELASKLHLSNRTISKWECGKGIPDSSVMMELCDVLGISVNELLSGEKLSGENYISKADENVIALIAEPEYSYKKERLSVLRSIALGLILLLFTVFFMFLNVVGAAQFLDYFDIPSILGVVGCICISLLICGLSKDFFRALKWSILPPKDISKDNLLKAILSVKVVALTAVIAGMTSSTASTIGALVYTSPDNNAALPAALAVATLGILYGCIIALFLMPVLGKLRILQIAKEEEDL